MKRQPASSNLLARRRLSRALRAVVALLVAATLSMSAAGAPAESPDEPTGLPWYVPDFAKVQHAGNIGFLSAGAGYAYLNQMLESELFFGFVPAFVGDDAVYTGTFKQHFVPWEFALGEQVRVVPLYLGVFASYTFGNAFEVFPDNWAGGDKYYAEQSALRVGPLVGGRLRAEIGPLGPLDDIGAYWELNVSDLGLRIYSANTDYFDFYEVMALGLGVRAGFR